MIFQFQLEGEHLNCNQRALDNGYIEGDLQIYVDGQLYLTKAAVNGYIRLLVVIYVTLLMNPLTVMNRCYGF